ncbi:hypothetical protein GGD63_006137 [Bradyrhizobium sp. cir1]|uniref:hypothetical protein n=1 Tax=Bradyrhizobium sp. cir1 TaxID=1445730 RepID=UPI0016057480|nr:hypothetical protein [Bradyrhizobium sp. cir1]MBB4373315.1 hypothetical protein [Bradyrhizobium sp. cir1]
MTDRLVPNVFVNKWANVKRCILMNYGGFLSGGEYASQLGVEALQVFFEVRKLNPGYRDQSACVRFMPITFRDLLDYIANGPKLCKHVRERSPSKRCEVLPKKFETVKEHCVQRRACNSSNDATIKNFGLRSGASEVNCPPYFVEILHQVAEIGADRLKRFLLKQALHPSRRYNLSFDRQPSDPTSENCARRAEQTAGQILMVSNDAAEPSREFQRAPLWQRAIGSDKHRKVGRRQCRIDKNDQASDQNKRLEDSGMAHGLSLPGRPAFVERVAA